jgi:flagellar hook-associated protein 3 FlgL
MTRVSTFGQNDFAVTNLMKVQSTLAEIQMQVSTELVSDSYKDIASDTVALKMLEADLEKSNNIVSNAETITARVDTMYSAVGNMVDILAQFQVTLSSAISGETAESAALNENAEAALDSFVAQANVQMSGRYLFGGSNTSNPPVDVSDPPYAAQSYPSVENYDYYQGDEQEAVFFTSDNDKITYGVTASESGFEVAIRALSLAANATESPADQDALLEAYDLVNEALDELLIVQSGLSTTASNLEREIDMELDYQLTLDAMIGDIKNVDLAAVLSEQEQLQVLLEASYNVTVSMSKMNLFEYLT